MHPASSNWRSDRKARVSFAPFVALCQLAQHIEMRRDVAPGHAYSAALASAHSMPFSRMAIGPRPRAMGYASRVDVWQILSTLASVVTALAVVFAAGQLRVAREQSHRDFENLYVQRYWSLLDKFSVEATLDEARAAATPADHAIALNYMRLCEDQLDMRRLGRITNKTWSFWSAAIQESMSEASYVKLRNDYPSSFGQIRMFVVRGEDPFKGNRLVAWFGGL